MYIVMPTENICWTLWIVYMFYNYTPSWARISKRLGGPWIDSKESIPPGWELIPGILKMFTVHIRALYHTPIFGIISAEKRAGIRREPGSYFWPCWLWRLLHGVVRVDILILAGVGSVQLLLQVSPTMDVFSRSLKWRGHWGGGGGMVSIQL